MEAIDNLSPELRNTVNEFGYYIVNSFVQNGINKASKIRHLVEVVLNELSPIRGANSFQGEFRGQNKADSQSLIITTKMLDAHRNAYLDKIKIGCEHEEALEAALK